jgi:hypothetical protein
MTIVVKCDPPEPNSGDEIWVDQWAYKGASPVLGEEVFVWTAEMSGGQGLEMSGLIQSVERHGRNAALRIRVLQRNPARRLTISTLREHRNSLSSAPISTLAKKLYKEAHNKVAELDEEEARFLREHFSA